MVELKFTCKDCGGLVMTVKQFDPNAPPQNGTYRIGDRVLVPPAEGLKLRPAGRGIDLAYIPCNGCGKETSIKMTELGLKPPS